MSSLGAVVPEEQIHLLDSSNKLTTVEAGMTVLKSFVGAAILAMPFGFRISGYAGAIACVVLMSGAVNLVVKYLLQIKCKVRELRKERGGLQEISYPELAFETGGPWAHFVIVASLVVSQVGVVTAYHIFISRSIDGWVTPGDLATGSVGPFYRVIPVCAMPIIALVVLGVHSRTKNLGLVGAVGNTVEILTLIVVIIYSYYLNCVDDKSTCGVQGVEALEWTTLPMTLGIAAFAMEGIYPLMPLEHTMVHPEHFHRVVDFGTYTAAILCCCFGFAGSWIFGIQTAAVITLNVTGLFGICVKLALSCVLLISYPLQLFPVMQWTDYLVRERLEDDAPHLVWVQRGVVLCFVLFTTLVATFLPNFGNTLSLVGCVGISIGGIIVPPILYIRAFPAAAIKDKIILGLLFVFGLFVLIAGSIYNLDALISGAE